MVAINECPDPDTLQQVLLGLGSPESVEEFETHISTCPKCAEAAGSLPTEDDFVKAVRKCTSEQDTPEPGLVATLVSLFSRAHSTGTLRTLSWSSIPSKSDPSANKIGILAPPQAADEIGRLGPYHIHEVLGAGGMGVVYRGFDPRLQRAVAVKVIRPELLTSQGITEQFVAEARAAAAIEQDHIVVVHSVEVHDGVPCITMPLLKGHTLDHRLLTHKGPLAEIELLRIAREVATGLAAAHQKGMIHRDIKPGNLWLEAPQSRIKILDFGLAIPADNGVASFAGTPGYMAPEQARGLSVDGRTDLFSLGCVLYKAATGALPFKADTPIGIIVRTVMDHPRPTCEVNPQLRPEIAQLIDRLIAKKPEDRFASADDLLLAIAEIEDGIQAQRNRVTRRRWIAGVAIAAGLSGVGGWIAFSATQPNREPPVRVELSGDADLGKVILSRDNIDVTLEVSDDTAVSLNPGEYQIRSANPVAGREPNPKAILVRAGKPSSVKIALVGEVAQSKAHSQAVTGITIVPGKDRFTVLTVSLDRTLGSWDPTPSGEAKFVRLDSPALCVDSTTDGSIVATAGGNKQPPFDMDIHFWDGQSLKPRGKPLVGHSKRVSTIAVTPDGKSLISAAMGELWLWDLTAATYQPLEGHNEKVMTAAIHANGKEALTGDETGYLILWDVAKAKMIRRIMAQGVGSEGRIYAVAFTPTGFVSTGDDGIIRIWDRETFKVRELPAEKKPLRAMAVSKDGTRVLTGGQDGTVKLWSITDGILLSTYTGHTEPVRGVTFSPDERNAISCSDDRTVRVWRLPY